MSSWEAGKKSDSNERHKPHLDAITNVSYYKRIIRDWDFDLADPGLVENLVTVRVHDSGIEHLPQPGSKDKWGYDKKTAYIPTEYIVLQISYLLKSEKKCFNISFHQSNLSFTQELDKALGTLKNLGKATGKNNYYYPGK